ncbi:hypothetical protein LRP88_14311 [Fusarium phalaenopsidis]
MSQPSANPGADQSENHDPDSGQFRKNNPETTDSHAAKIKDEPPFTRRQRIDSWRTKIEEPSDHHEMTEDHVREDSGLSEDWKLTPLHELLKRIEDDDNGSHELEKCLDQWKDIIDARSPEHQETALHMAVQKGFSKMARQLLTAGAEVNIKNGNGELPLHAACEYGNQQLVEILLENDADPERMDASGNYPLHSAVVRGFEATVVRGLFGPGGFVINKPVGGTHWTPLNKAIYYECEDVVDVLLEGRASLRIRDSDGWTPLMTAIREGLYNTFDKLLKHLQENPTEQDVVIIPDNDGITPLMQLCANKPGELATRAIEHLLEMNPDVNVTDTEGKTALHHAMASSAYWIWREMESDTDVALKLVHSLSVKRLLHPDKNGETAFDVAFDADKRSPTPAFEPLFNSLIDRLAQGGLIEELFCWAAYRLERHTFAQDLFRKRFAAGVSQDLSHDQWTILEWAIYACMPRVLLTYLRTLGLEKTVAKDKIDNSISSGRELIKKLDEKRQTSKPLAERKRQRGGRGPASGAVSNKDDQVLRDMEDILDYLYPEKVEKPTRPLDLSKPDKSMASSLKHFRAAIIQSNFVKFRTIQEVLYNDDKMKHMEDIVTRLKQFEYTPRVSSEQASTTSEDFQENNKTKAQFTWIHLPSTNDTAKKILKGEGCCKSEAEKVASFLRSSWIEIPDRTSTSRFMRPRYVVKKADNATKRNAEGEGELKDVSERESSRTDIRSRHNEQRGRPNSDEDDEDSPNEGQNNPSEEISNTRRREREEESNSHSHVSRAVQTVDTDCGDAEKGKSFAVSAIYMPYLYFSTYHQIESGKRMTGTETQSDLEKKVQAEIEMRDALFEAYRKSVIHQPTTLDEFYYQFASDKDSVGDRDSRNKDQVVTKYLQGLDIKKQRFWPLLRVSQLWIWTIDDKWLITSTSCATNDIRDNLVTDILGHLQRQVENGSRRLGPTSAAEMSQVIVDYCIGTYDRKRRRQDVNGQHQVNMDRVDQSTTEDGKHKEERSIHQIFSDSINEIGRKESSLFNWAYQRRNDATELKTGLDADRTFKMMKALRAALTTVSEQLCHIKDIRDELNILMSIARFQRKVQVTMAGKGTDEDLSSHYLLRDIKELDKFAEQTQEAVKTTLTLQESDIAGFQAEIANWQASESVKQGKESFKQGKIVLIFTLVTVWFLPLSFLTSLFALDVATFMQAPAWAFYIIFLVPLIFLGSAVGYVWKAEIRGYLPLGQQHE